MAVKVASGVSFGIEISIRVPGVTPAARRAFARADSLSVLWSRVMVPLERTETCTALLEERLLHDEAQPTRSEAAQRIPTIEALCFSMAVN